MKLRLKQRGCRYAVNNQKSERVDRRGSGGGEAKMMVGDYATWEGRSTASSVDIVID